MLCGVDRYLTQSRCTELGFLCSLEPKILQETIQRKKVIRTHSYFARPCYETQPIAFLAKLPSCILHSPGSENSCLSRPNIPSQNSLAIESLNHLLPNLFNQAAKSTITILLEP